MILSVNDVTLSMIESVEKQKRKEGNQGTKDSKFYYKDIICAFDIETTRLKIGSHAITKYKKHNGIIKKFIEEKDDNIAIMYIWQFQFGLDITIIGRTWEDFNTLMLLIDSALEENERLCVFIHNASYEFQFLRDKNILGKYLDEENVFILSSRKILRFTAFHNKIEFRCSYIHSNMSLDLYTSKMGVTHKKQSGEEFDYNKIRFPWTELTDFEIKYATYDVIGLVEAIEKEMYIDGDNLYTFVLTSTGYVRRDIRTAIRDGLPKTWVKERKPDYDTYNILYDAFRGGNTHANRGIAGKRVDGNIWEFDRSSSYPDVQMNGKFPISKFHKPRQITYELFENCIKKGYAVIARIRFEYIKLIDYLITVPYISESNCTYLSKNYREDNGRILNADELELALTEIDLSIILNQYRFEYIEVIDFRFASKGDLPECIKDVIRKYYTLKTELKGDDANAIIYMKSKNKLNSIYGNSAQNPAKMNILYREGKYMNGYYNKRSKKEEIIDETQDIDSIKAERDEILQLIYEESDTVLPYQFGVYTTALSRYELQKMIDICGDNFLYCDTDSVYFVQDGTISFDEYNREKKELSTKNRAYATDSNGKLHYMGVAECERDDIISFKTLGAKKYAYITKDGDLHITISGVSKKYSVSEVMKEYSTGLYTSPLDILESGFQFIEAGGNEIIYNDFSIESYNIDGHDLYIPSNAVIQPSTYELGYSDDYIGTLISVMNSNISIYYEEKLRLPIDIESIL